MTLKAASPYGAWQRQGVDEALEERAFMSVGQPERTTQDRVVKLFHDQLDYDYLGNWELPRRQHRTSRFRHLRAESRKARGYGDNLITGKAVERAARGRRRSVVARSVRGQPRCLWPAALRRQRSSRLPASNRDGLADRLGRTRSQPLRHRRRGHGLWAAHQAPGCRALRQRHGARLRSS